VEFIHAAKVNVQTVQRGALGRERLKLGARGHHVHVVRPDIHREPVAKPRAAACHGLRVPEHNAGLVTGGRQRIDLSTTFTIGCQHVQAHRRRQSGLGIASWHLDVGAAKAPRAIGLDPAEHRREDEHLPRLQRDGLSGKRALDVRQSLNECAQVVRRVVGLAALAGELGIEAVGAGLALVLFQITELPLAGSLHPLARQDLSGHDFLCVHLGNVRITALSH